MTIKVWEARGIPKMDRFGKTDAFARVAFGGVSYGETEVVESQDPYWGTEYRHDQMPLSALFRRQTFRG